MMASDRIVSLWDMLEKLEAERLVQAVAYLASCAKRYQAIHSALLAGRVFDSNLNEEHDLNLPAFFATAIENIAQNLGMAGVQKSAIHVKCCLYEYGRKSAPADHAMVFQITQAFSTVLESFGNEMKARQLFILTGKYAHHFEPNDAPFGEDVANIFLECAYDIEESRKCLALERSTASGFHLMRAAEGAASVVLRHLGGNPIDDKGEQRTFGALVVQIDSKIEAMARGDEKDRWMRLKSFMAACNRGFRTKIAHPGVKYTMEESERLFGLTESLLQESAELLRL